MTDKELLELAAKAAGLKKDDSPYNGGGRGNDGFCITGAMMLDWSNNKRWNPLTDDGDALRLAVKLQIDIEWRYGEVWAYRHASADGECFTAIEAAADHDPEIIGTGDRATRRAITRAAAEIGKTMKS
jgi:hypothetical protein